MNEMDEKTKKVKKRMRIAFAFPIIGLCWAFVFLFINLAFPNTDFSIFWGLTFPVALFIALGAAIITITENDIKNGRI